PIDDFQLGLDLIDIFLLEDEGNVQLGFLVMAPRLLGWDPNKIIVKHRVAIKPSELAGMDLTDRDGRLIGLGERPVERISGLQCRPDVWSPALAHVGTPGQVAVASVAPLPFDRKVEVKYSAV